MKWFDTHLDLACIALCGRDMRAVDPAAAGGADAPGGITFPSLKAGNVQACLGTIFIEPDGAPPVIAYSSGDSGSANRAALAQLDLYHRWRDHGLIRLMNAPEVGRTDSPLLGILVEGADGIVSPDDLAWWVERGVVAIGLAWAKQTRYAGGNTTQNGLTDLGRHMVKEMDRLKVVHDASHLSDASLSELFSLTDKPVIASHSNCRAIVDLPSEEPRQRHLTDSAIREIARRGGVIGVNLFSMFIIPGGKKDRRATIDEWCEHVDHICDIVGDHKHVGLGSDADGGFSCLKQPEGINCPADYKHLLERLARRGWKQPELEALAWNNWANFWKVTS